MILTGLLAFGESSGQEMKTDKVRFSLKSTPASPPVIGIIAPAPNDQGYLHSQEADIDIIGQVSSAIGVSIVTVNSKMAEVNDDGMFTYSVHLVLGENHFKLIAVDEEKQMGEELITISYSPPVLSLADRIREEATYYALIIGIDQYRDESIPDLGNPIKDAEKVYEALLTHYTFSEDHIWFLRDATRGDLIQTLDELANVITPDDNLLIFYAGHGWWDEEANNGYWLPSDADHQVKTNWFRNSALVDYLKEINSRHTLLIADACFGGSIFRTRTAFPSKEKAYEKLYELPSRKAMTSGQLTEVPDRSSFTRFLVERLNNNPETYISSEQLFSSFRIAVINNSDVIPEYGEIGRVGDQGGDFIFIRK